MENGYTGLEIAVIGMSCRVPDALNYRELWNNLVQGIESMETLDAEELINSGITPEMDAENFVKVKRELKNKAFFDYQFFNYTSNEARLLSPQSRGGHECLWEAIEDAGYMVKAMENTALFLGIAEDLPWRLHVNSEKTKVPVDNYSFNFLSEHQYTPALLSYKFGFKGVTIPVVTACSSSLVAVDMAYKNLLLGSSNIAIAGGVNIVNYAAKGYFYEEGKIESKDGHCRAFDRDASGTSWGEGIGFVVLKRLKDAIKDNDHIYCLIKGSATNNDANRRVGYTAPSVSGQMECISKALKFSRVTPASISYVEMHGTGTQLGDPIEVEALNKAYNLNSPGTIPIGSIKSNIGHLNFAAGVIGFIKAALCLKNNLVPASINFSSPNPNINFQNGPFYVVQNLTELKRKDGGPLRAAVTSLGIGGTNAHVILEEAPFREEGPAFDSEIPDVLTITAKTYPALLENARKIIDMLKTQQVRIDDLAYTTRISRSGMGMRKGFAFTDKSSLLASLTKFVTSNPPLIDPQNLAKTFVFAGQGVQYPAMGLACYNTFPVFKENMDVAFEYLNKLSGIDYKEICYSAGDERLNDTLFTQVIIFSFQYSMAKLLISSGVEPQYLIGHSLGEYTAACISGVFSFEDTLSILCKRAELMSQLPAGKMLSIMISRDKLSAYLSQLNGPVYIAAENYAGNFVVAGLNENIDQLVMILRVERVVFLELNSQKPFHTPFLEVIATEFKEFLETIRFNKLQIPFISCLTGDFISIENAMSPDYWVSQMLNPVQFYNGVKNLLKHAGKMGLIDVGPGNSNTKIIRNIDKDKIVLTTYAKENECFAFVSVLSQLWENGADIKWDSVLQPGLKIPIPTYSFDKHRFETNIDMKHFLSNRNKKNKKYFTYKETWTKKEMGSVDKSGQNFIVFSNDQAAIDRIMACFGQIRYFAVVSGDNYERKDNVIRINWTNEDHYKQLFSSLKSDGFTPEHLLFLWNETAEDTAQGIAYGYDALAYITRNCDTFFFDKKINLSLIGNGLYKVGQQDTLNPIKATAVGAVKVINTEFSNLHCRIIDVEEMHEVTAGYINKIINEGSELETAIRDGNVFVKRFDKLKLTKHNRKRLHTKAVYLLTGGYGGLGFEIAKYLAENFAAKLIIVGRRGEDLHKREVLEKLGAQVSYLQSNLGNLDELKSGITIAEQFLGDRISGVIHASGVGDYKGIVLNRPLIDDKEVFDPKIQGTVNLWNCLSGHQIEFFAGFSSLAVTRPFIGQLAYTAANSFLENFLSSKGGISIEWPIVSGVGMAVDALKEVPVDEHEKILSASISPKSVVKLFFKAIHSRENLIVVSKNDINYIQDRSHSISPVVAGASYFRADLSDSKPYVEPGTVVESDLVNIIKDVLSFDRIGMNDNLYELGSDSLKAMVILSKIKEKFQIEYSLRALLDAENIAVIANEIENSLTSVKTVEANEEEKVVITI